MARTFRAIFGGLPNYGDEATLSGGSWEASLPIDNIKNRRLRKVARSTSADPNDTRWTGDFGVARTIGMCALIGINWTTAAKWRFRVLGSPSSPFNGLYMDNVFEGVIASGAGTIYGATGNFALGVWLKIDQSGSPGRHGIFGQKTSDAMANFPLAIFIETSGRICFEWTSGGVAKSITTAAAPFTAYLWHHLGVSISGTTITFVVDGVELESYTDAALVGRDAAAGGTGADVLVARQGTSSTASGGLYNLAYWSTSRTAAEFASDMFRTWTGSETNLTGLWSGAITGGPILNNLTANNHDFACNSTPFGFVVWNEAPTLYDSGILDAFPPVEEFGTLPWGEFQWGGALPAEISESLTPQVFHVCTEVVQGRYYSVEIIDNQIEKGFCDVGRAIVGPYFQPLLNMDWGFSIGYEDESLVDKSRGGQTYIEARDVFRSARFTFSNMTEAEALQQVLFWLQRRLGVKDDFVFIPFPDRPDLTYITAMYCRMRSLPPVYNSAYEQWQSQFEVEELL